MLLLLYIYLRVRFKMWVKRLFLISRGNRPTDAAQCARQNALKTSSVAIELLELEQLDDVGVQGRGVSKGTGGYRRRLQTAVTNGSCVVSETEMKPKRNRNGQGASGSGAVSWAPCVCCASHWWVGV